MNTQKSVTTITQYNWKRLFIILLCGFAALDICQALLTEVMNDEAYYWLWGQHLAWGYFDHPPMVALFTFLSSHLMPFGNLSVRFMTIIAHALTLFLVWKIIDDKEPSGLKVCLFFVISASLIMFSVYGFITTPDVGLLLFTALFLWLYQKYLQNNTYTYALLMGLSMACMLYSKYHAVLIIGLIVLSNPRLLIQGKAWLAVGVTVLLMIPHLLWQINAGFPSFQYHLIDRQDAFSWIYILEYVPNQLVVFNPVTLFFVFAVLFRFKPKDVFERGLYFLIFGFLGFFWLMAIRGHVEPHWTMSASIPMIILLYRASVAQDGLKRAVFKWITPTLFLIFLCRVAWVTPPIAERIGLAGEKQKYETLAKNAGDKPVIFTGSFQQPSLYQYFTKKEAVTLSNICTRRCQFDVWEKELDYQGKDVFFPESDTSGYVQTNFQSVNRIQIDYELPTTELIVGDTLVIPITISNPTDYDVDFKHASMPVNFYAVFEINEDIDLEYDTPDKDIDVLPAHHKMQLNLQTVIPDIQGDALFSFSLHNNFCFAYNAKFLEVKIKKK